MAARRARRARARHLRTALVLSVLAIASLLAWLVSVTAPSGLDASAGHGRAAAPAEQRAEHSEATPARIDPPRATHEGGRALERSAARSLAGRVVHADTGEALAGYGIVARTGDGAAAEDVSDARGRFVLRDVHTDSARVHVIAPFGWVALDVPRDVARNEQDEFAPLQIRARPAGFAPLRLRLVDERTDEPLPHYLVRIGTPQGSRASAVSDAQGLLTSEQVYPEGDLLLFGYDHQHPDLGEGEPKAHWYREFQHAAREAEVAELALRVPAGPTYVLDLDAPGDAPFDRLAALVGSSAPAFPRADSARRSHAAGVRGGPGHWVRFSPRVGGVAAPGVLSVFSHDGRWYGEAPVGTQMGVDPARVPIRLERRSRILGRALDESGEPVANAVLTLFGRQSSKNPTPLQTARSGGNGVFEFAFAPGGAYVVQGAGLDTQPGEVEFHLRDGEDLELELILPRARSVGPVSGRIVAPSDTGLDSVDVRLTSARLRGRAFEAEVALTASDGELTGEFEFADVPGDDYLLEVRAWRMRARTRQSLSIDVRAPRVGLEIRLAGADDLRCMRASARDALTGATLTDARLDFEWDADVRPLATFRGLGERCVPAAWLESGHWIVVAEGYAPARGALSGLHFVDGEARIEAELRPGWGCSLQVLGPGHVALPDVEVLADDESVARTDRFGRALLTLDSQPRSLGLRRSGWRLELDSASALQVACMGASGVRVWMRTD